MPCVVRGLLPAALVAWCCRDRRASFPIIAEPSRPKRNINYLLDMMQIAIFPSLLLLLSDIYPTRKLSSEYDILGYQSGNYAGRQHGGET
jgi:hypothetical protein